MKAALIAFVSTLICFSNGTGLGGINEVTNPDDRTSYANKALEQLERSTNSINARKIVEVSNSLIWNEIVRFQFFNIYWCYVSNCSICNFWLHYSNTQMHLVKSDQSISGNQSGITSCSWNQIYCSLQIGCHRMFEGNWNWKIRKLQRKHR